MCGIVGAVSNRNINEILIEGLKRLEYRGYDSAGIAVINQGSDINRCRSVGKVAALEQRLANEEPEGTIGIAHTRWATHGKPSESNAHPHMSSESLAIVHNGIIENYEDIRKELAQKGYSFESETDSETIAHLIHSLEAEGLTLLSAVKAASKKLKGAYGLCAISNKEADKIVVARSGSPLVLGLGIGENFIGSDALALQNVTNRFIFLEEGDVAVVETDKIEIFDHQDQPQQREVVEFNLGQSSAEKGDYRHFMEKEIFEQPKVVQAALEGRISEEHLLDNIFGIGSKEILSKVKNIQLIACGTSYHAGLVAKYWMESVAKIPCHVEVASEFRYRKKIVSEDTLFLSISQSGETADTLAALREADHENYLASLVICNVYGSSLVRESDFSLMMNAGAEIGVASTKAFSAQLVLLFLLVIALAKSRGLEEEKENYFISELRNLSDYIEAVLEKNAEIEELAKQFADKNHALFLGRGPQYPIAMEGALKLKEISYIHAEAYPAGELKHGPLALVDDDMPVIAVAPNNKLAEKLKSNLQEVASRGGELYIFADETFDFNIGENLHIIQIPKVPNFLIPIVYNIPLQLLSYHVALIKGTDVDQPRNLAKSVTVE